MLEGMFPLTAPSGLPGGAPENVVIADFIQAGAGWSAGQQTVLPLGAQPTITRPWTILGYGLQFTGGYQINDTAGDSIAGKLGRLYGGIVAGSAQNSPPQPFTTLPQDFSNVTELWDGQQDSMFPALAAPNVGDARATTVQLPQPILLSAGEQLSAGLWLTPSLLSPVGTGRFPAITGVYLAIVTAGWVIQYTTGG